MKKNENKEHVLKIIFRTFCDILFLGLSIPSIFLDKLLPAIGMLGVLMLRGLTFGSSSKGTGDNKLVQSDKQNDNGDNAPANTVAEGTKFTPIEPMKQGADAEGISEQELEQRSANGPIRTLKWRTGTANVDK